MLNRRSFLGGLSTLPLLGLAPSALAAPNITFPIPASGEAIPAVGLGSWLTFDVMDIGDRRQRCQEVIGAFFDRGGAMIDSSPMYGFAQAAIGQALDGLANDQALFSATKVWTPGAAVGRFQMNNALESWGLDTFDLLHVHNMVDWASHLPWMNEWKQEGRIRYTGITTSHGRRHDAMATVIRDQPFDFVQFTYNLTHREAEERLLPLAQDHGKAVVINRPFDGGHLFDDMDDKPLPDWAGEIACENWAQYFLKFVISHPAVTCAIPATSRVDHLHENMGALHGPLPDEAMRREMVAYFNAVKT